jgi:hypothetical protein
MNDPMRDRDEIQRAHDIMTAVALDEQVRRRVFEPGRLQVVKANLDALCWVLRHDHNRTLAVNLILLETKLKVMGIEIARLDEMQYPDLTS